MPKWTKQPKLTNNSLPLIAENKKITSAEFNELTGIVNDNFDLTVAPADQPYGRQGENWVELGDTSGFVTLSTVQTITGVKTFPNTVGITSILPKAVAVGGNGGLTITHPQDDAGSFSIAILSINGSARSYFEFKKTGLSAVMSMLNNASAPPSFYNSRGNLYVEAGALKYRGTSGTVTNLANA
jgi:hypothetical protein